jgi:hypothetical protein
MQEQQSDRIKDRRVQQQEAAYNATRDAMIQEYVSHRGMDGKQISDAIEQLNALLAGISTAEIMRLENTLRRSLLKNYSPNRSTVSRHLEEQLDILLQHRLVWQAEELNAEEQSAAMGQIIRELELRLTASSRIKRMPGDVTNPPDIEQIRNNMPSQFSQKPAFLEKISTVMADPVTAVLDDLFPIQDNLRGEGSNA